MLKRKAAKRWKDKQLAHMRTSTSAEESRDENEMKECSFYDIINEYKLYIYY